VITSRALKTIVASAKAAGVPVTLCGEMAGNPLSAMALIGVGYLIVALDITRNRALVWLGIFAKAYDVVILTWRFLIDIARPIVLVPAAIAAAFILLFVWFLYATRRDEGLLSRQPEAAC